ncbi:hypothetical protein J6590_067985 [Homalodisca vitripennis]|nr:hypothetical protein J6590_067985 [Homalodisca vitripennis]
MSPYINALSTASLTSKITTPTSTQSPFLFVRQHVERMVVNRWKNTHDYHVLVEDLVAHLVKRVKMASGELVRHQGIVCLAMKVTIRIYN